MHVYIDIYFPMFQGEPKKKKKKKKKKRIARRQKDAFWILGYLS